MTGGKLHVPINMYSMFVQLYLESANDLYIVERFGGIFIFFLDIDNYSNTNALIETLIDKYKRDFIVLKCTKNKGFHVIFPEWRVNVDQATKLANILETPKPDTGVYKGHSLRMPGSLKPNENRSYMPIGFTKSGEFIHCTKLTNQLFKECCVSVSEYATFSKAEASCVISKQGYLQKILEGTELQPYYQNAKITRVTKLGKYTILVSNSHYCQNIQDNHKSNCVYFVISPDKCIRQKCFCRCSHRTCSTYKGKKYPINYSAYYSTFSHV